MWAGFFLGLAELTKTTWLILYVLWPVQWVIFRIFQHRSLKFRVAQESLQVAAILVLSIYVLNLGYCFSGSFKRLGDYQFVSRTLAGEAPPHAKSLFGNRFAGSWLGRVPVPLPEDYVAGVDLQRSDFDNRMWSYLNGEWRLGGWWYYYLFALAIKVPVGGLLLLALAFAVSLWHNSPLRMSLDELCLLLPFISILGLVSSQTGFNHHIRYVLPIFPFAFIFISKLARSIELRQTSTALIACAALLWFITSSLYVFPHSLCYYNEIIGGPKRGHYYLGNSNTDWGQDLFYLRDWTAAHPQAVPLYVATDLPFVSPAILGIRSQPLPPDGLSPGIVNQRGWFAISVNQLHRMDGRFKSFLSIEPVDRAGYTINIYHLTTNDVKNLRRATESATQTDERTGKE